MGTEPGTPNHARRAAPAFTSPPADLDDAAWDREQRSETPTERLDRNWAALLQELRVVQTGVQILTGFLLTLPFQSRFADAPDWLRTVYLITVACAVPASILLAAPVALHRLLFRRHRLDEVVGHAHRLAFGGLLLLGLSLCGSVVVVFGATAGPTAAAVAGAITLVLVATFWVAIPMSVRYRYR
ncbi:DUF6328 family protein [Gordonia sinesedis]